MRCLAILAFAACATVNTDAVFVPKRHVLHERSLPSVNSKWRRGEKVARDSIVPLRIGLVQTNLELGDKHLMDVADPRSASYGKHWTAAEVHDVFAPAASAVAEVKNWLVEYGIKEDEILHFENKGWLAADIPAYKVERLFRTSLYEHEHHATGDIRIGCSEYHVPAHLKHYIDYSKANVLAVTLL